MTCRVVCRPRPSFDDTALTLWSSRPSSVMDPRAPPPPPDMSTSVMKRLTASSYVSLSSVSLSSSPSSSFVSSLPMAQSPSSSSSSPAAASASASLDPARSLLISDDLPTPEGPASTVTERGATPVSEVPPSSSSSSSSSSSTDPTPSPSLPSSARLCDIPSASSASSSSTPSPVATLTNRG